jgi:2-polyprenyl-6-methoxyphenol hydroxylase-like FAD-dependent oxidoreductase
MVGSGQRRRAADGGRGHAVVIGGSMAGLTVAQALATGYERITVVDRDRLGTDARARPGVPQGRHLHALLARGAEALERLFPRIIDEFVAEGATACDHLQDIRLVLGGHRLDRGDRLGRRTVLASRPFLEGHVRRRLLANDRVQLVEGQQVVDLLTTRDRRRVTGVRLTSADRGAREAGSERTIGADLVVDCSGRRSRLPQWLQDLGYAPPPVERLRVDLHYATRRYRLPSDVLDGDQGLLIAPPASAPPRAAAMLRIEGDVWLVGLGTMAGERPPAEDGSFERFTAGLIASDAHDALRAGEPLDAPARFRYPAEVRHRYERLRHVPEGLLVAGDAVCSFNPIYGQGMTVAAMEAEVLRRHLVDGTPLTARRWFEAIRPIVDVPWDLATSGDLAHPQVAGRRSPRTRLLNRYVERLHATAAHDPDLTERFVNVAGLLEPPQRLIEPGVVARVLRGPVTAHPSQQLRGEGSVARFRRRQAEADLPSVAAPVAGAPPTVGASPSDGPPRAQLDT